MSIGKIIRENIVFIMSLTILLIFTIFVEIISPYILERSLSIDHVVWYFLLYVGVTVINHLAKVVYEFIKKKYTVIFKTKQSIQLLEKIYKMKYTEIINIQPTYLIHRTDEAVNNVFTLITNGISDFISGFLAVAIIIILMFQYNGYLALLYTTYTVLSFIGYKLINKTLLKKSMVLQDTVSTNFKNILSFMTNVDFFKLLPKFQLIGRYLSRFFKDNAKINAEVGFFAAGISILLSFFLNILQSGIFLLVFYSAMTGSIALGKVAVVILLNTIFRNSMTIVNETNISLRDVKASINFINQVVIAKQEPPDGNIRMDSLDNVRIVANHIGYGNETLIESGVFEAHKGQVVGLSAESGSGKSTLIKVLLGLIRDTSSLVSYNDIPLDDLSAESYKERISSISQNASVFPISIRDNLCLYLSDDEIPNPVYQQRIQNVTAMHGFNKFLTLEEGLSTMVLEGSANLSGGDKQKIAIGRVLIRSPDLIILDEFTSSIDSETEQSIFHAIKEAAKNKIVILITHNMKMLSLCDIVYGIKNKQIMVI